VTPKQHEFFNSLKIDVFFGAGTDGWWETNDDDHPATLRALERNGYIETRHREFRLTEKGRGWVQSPDDTLYLKKTGVSRGMIKMAEEQGMKVHTEGGCYVFTKPEAGKT